MGGSSYFKEVLRRYQNNFDLYYDYFLDGKKYPAYGYFFSLGEKYILSKEANLWSIKAFEHVLFLEKNTVTVQDLEELFNVMQNQMEPHLVRKGEKYPEKDHMISYLTIVIIADNTPSVDVIKQIQRFKFDKGYLFNFRGHSEGGIVLSCLDRKIVYTNRSAKRLKKMFLDVFKYLDKSKAGLTAAC